MTIKVKNQILKYLNNLKSFGYKYHEDFDISSNELRCCYIDLEKSVIV